MGRPGRVKILGAVARALERVSSAVGNGAAWLALVMVVVGAFNALSRYLGRFTGSDLSSNAYIELQWYLFSALFLLGAADALREDAHVRVDVVYGRLGPRAGAVVDLIGTLVFLLPFCAFALWTSLPMVENSWRVMEQSPDPGGLPRYPIKTLIPVGLLLVMLQGIAVCCRRIRVLSGEQDENPNMADGRTRPEGR
ncbi:MAG: TRAP transporter small permease subunit [Myxococcales bacterium]|nr:TRAP transporter small permease subunit [Myxococcales bacterium]